MVSISSSYKKKLLRMGLGPPTVKNVLVKTIWQQWHTHKIMNTSHVFGTD